MARIASARLRMLVADANDGIIATAGIVEGLLGAGVETDTIVVAAAASMISGAIALGAVKYSEAATERDAVVALLDAEQRQLELSPEEELAELAEFYVAKGLSPELAGQVAHSLTLSEAVAVHVEAEHGVSAATAVLRPSEVAAASGLASAAGAAVVVATAIFTPQHWRVPATLIAVVISLCCTSVVVGRWGQVPLARTLGRTVVIGTVAMLVTLALGSLVTL